MSKPATFDFSPAYDEFLQAFPQYVETAAIDKLRAEEYQRLDEQQHVYLDYTGGGLYPANLVRWHAELLQDLLLGNPHSQNPTSLASTRLVAQARADVLDYFNADPEEYLVIFTQNASGALKLLGESYPFNDNAQFLLVADNHNSVHGIREFARSRGAEITYIPLDPVSLRAPDPLQYFEQGRQASPRLFAFPAQSNYSGVQHPLEWVEQAQAHGYHVLLDAAAFVPTNRLDLRAIHPDFVPISFYKIFGYPTGIGALLARRQALQQLQRPWFAGGTVQLVSTKADLHILARDHEAFEEGTVNYLGLPALSYGFQFIRRVGIETVHQRVVILLEYLLSKMQALRHSNGAPLLQIYGPTDIVKRGGSIACNVLDPDGVLVPYQQVEDEANAANISIRSGCFCNPGAGEYSLTHTGEEISRCVELATSYEFDVDAFRRCLGDKATGAVRVSLGLVSNFEDVTRFLGFLAQFADRPAASYTGARGCS
ncbi:MAG: aminotransferase class V-fold PLP-dependent enzyme [Caldilineales bacterium]|nr:aminotransferase class V-fold PLP-dependent enzyme [Caldilineales bacterium]